MRGPNLDEIFSTVQRDTINVASGYELVKGFFFKVMNQPRLEKAYPWFLPALFLAVTGDIVMTLGRLFDNDPRPASLKTLLRQVESQPAGNVSSHLQGRREEFVAKIPAWLVEIRTANQRVAMPRNAYLAHNDLTKLARADIQWTEIRDHIDLARRIVRAYSHAFHGSDSTLVLQNVGWEIDKFLKWCRLDDYAAHRETERAARKAAFGAVRSAPQVKTPTSSRRPPHARKP